MNNCENQTDIGKGHQIIITEDIVLGEYITVMMLSCLVVQDIKGLFLQGF